MMENNNDDYGASEHKRRRVQGPGDCVDDEDGGCKRSRAVTTEDDVSVHGIVELADDEEPEDDGGGGSGEEYIYDDDNGGGYASETEADAEQRFRVLTEDGIRARQAADTARVAEVLSIPAGSAAALLRHFKWQPSRVQEDWFSDEARVRDAVGLVSAAGVGVAVAGERVVCGICFTGHAAGRKVSAGCAAHYYCRACWRGYIHAAVEQGPACLALRCPDPSCSAAVVRELVDEVMAKDADEKNRYAAFAMRSYVEDSGGRVKWCPGPGCAFAVELLVAGGESSDVSCACGHAFCFGCGEEAHRPVSCDTVRAWLAKNASDSANAKWVLAHTKPCPKCRRPIEKNQGCNNMTCRAPCHHTFCWLCLDPLSHHRGCSGYKQHQGESNSKRVVVESEAKKAKASLDRYLYHYERWSANQASLERACRDAVELRRSGLATMAAALGRPATELAFLAAAYEQVAHGRRVLRWAHAYGYYLDPDRDAAKRALFEHLQDQANAWLERLHACVELDRKDLFKQGADAGVVLEMLRPYRDKVTNLTRVTRTFLDNLVKAFETDLPEVKSLQ